MLGTAVWNYLYITVVYIIGIWYLFAIYVLICKSID